MPKIKTFDSSCFDEYKTIEKFFVLDKDIEPTMKRIIQNKGFQNYYVLLTKYLTENELNVDKIKIILRRHILLCIYKLLVNQKNPIERVKGFDGKLKNITISNLLDDELDFSCSPFYFLYKADTYSSVKHDIAEIIELCSCNDEEWVRSTITSLFDYFYINCGFAEIKYVNHTDLMISHSLFNQPNLERFSFKLFNVDEFLPNWKCTETSNNDYKEAVLGHVINIIFKNNNLLFDKSMDIKSVNYYSLMLNEPRKKSIQNTISFFDIDMENYKANIDISNLKSEFIFEYNGSKYNFTKNGIISL